MAEEKEYTPEMIWQLIYEIGEKQKESAEAADRRQTEWEKRNAAFDKRMEESAEAADRRQAEWEKRNAAFDKRMETLRQEIGGIAKSNGAMAEEAIYNALEHDKKFAGVKFDDIRKNIQIQSENFETLTELDILMLNGDTISLIETKYKVEQKDVIKLINKQLNDFRQCYPQYNNYKILLGIGGMSFEDKAEAEAKNNGVGIIKILGDKVEYHTEEIKIY